MEVVLELGVGTRLSLLEDSGFEVNAIDLTGPGIHSYDSNKISSLFEGYVIFSSISPFMYNITMNILCI
jgi:hypothetical protein